MIEGRSVLVTGGTGSLGKTLVRRLLSGRHGTPRKVIVLSRDEGKQHDMRLEYLHRSVSTDEIIYKNFQQALEFRIGDVRDYSDVCAALRDSDIVINAAALKQVPTCEYFPEQAVLTNCLGAHNIIRAIREHDFGIGCVVGVSTDKACKPINVMGMTKAIQERLFISANVLSPSTRFICVRYGNVLASRGSVIPLFHEQIRRGGPVTITDPTMTRFLLSLEEAVDTVLAAIDGAEPGEIYVPKAASATVGNIALALIDGRDIEVRIIGIRPGEKLHEILVSEEECHRTITRGQYHAIRSILPELKSEILDGPTLKQELSSAHNALSLEDTASLLARHDLRVGATSVVENGELLR